MAVTQEEKDESLSLTLATTLGQVNMKIRPAAVGGYCASTLMEGPGYRLSDDGAAYVVDDPLVLIEDEYRRFRKDAMTDLERIHELHDRVDNARRLALWVRSREGKRGAFGYPQPCEREIAITTHAEELFAQAEQIARVGAPAHAG